MGRRGRRPLPERCMSFVLAIDGCEFCDQNDLGRIISSPTTPLFIFHYSLFIIHFLPVGEAISLPRIQINIMFSSVVKTTNSIFAFTIKKKHAVACCPRVSSSHLCNSTVCYVASAYNIPKLFSEYRLESRTNSITTPQEVLLVLFFQEKNEKTRPPQANFFQTVLAK